MLLTEVPEFCGAEQIRANRAKDHPTGLKIYAMVDWHKEYASIFGEVLNQNPCTGNKAGGLLNITIKSLGAIVKARRGLWPTGATVVVFTTGNGTTIGRCNNPGHQTCFQYRVFEKMLQDLDISAGNMIEGTESIVEVGTRAL